MADVVLLLGPTGVDKQRAVARLNRWLSTPGDPDAMTFIDFERDRLVPMFGGEMFSLLDERETHQRSAWRKAAAQLVDDLAHDAGTVLVGMHGVFVRDIYGVRSVVDLPLLARLAPRRIITLIDDLYASWTRTEVRARRAAYKGRPTLSQLLDARRSEQLLGDLIAAHCENAPSHHLVSVNHPARLLGRIVRASEREVVPVYTSFPISGPRSVASDGDPDGMLEVDAFLRAVAEKERDCERVITFNPLSIDELPFVEALKHARHDGTVRFSPDQRWDVRRFWPDEVLLGDPVAEEIVVEQEQLNVVAGALRADVRIRDYRLVSQSRRVLALNPYFEGKLAAGVRNEIELAVFARRPIHIFQDREHDYDSLARPTFLGNEGALGSLPSSSYVTFHRSLDEAIDAALDDDD